MRLTFIGAAHEVTGSCFYLEAAGKRWLVDCGMEQGRDYYENQELPVPFSDIDFIILTHAHIDHSGNLPLAYAKGFRGNVYATEATCDLCEIMLKDCAHIQMSETEWKNRKARRTGKAEHVPTYTMEDAIGVIRKFVNCKYNELLVIEDRIRIRFCDAGHLLGSASVEIWITEDGKERKIVFSGDIGNESQPLLRDPAYLTEADYVVMESTYGDRSHGARPDYIASLTNILEKTFERGGDVVVPSFAVGRTQEMLYFLRKIKEERLVDNYPDFEVYVDSPLAVSATTIFKEHYRECYDGEAMELVQKAINPIGFPGLKLSITSEDSKAINGKEYPKVIISASGMCDAGRIKHHLKHHLWREDSTILFVGYQAVGTTGRALLDGASTVRLFGEDIQVRARIDRLPGISSHADDAGLLRWISAFKKKPEKVFIVHGDDKVCEIFTKRLTEELKYDAMAPFSGTIYDLLSNRCIKQTTGIQLRKAEADIRPAKTSAVYTRLAAAGQRLLTIIRRSEGGANKDLAKFADQIQALCDKWDR